MNYREMESEELFRIYQEDHDIEIRNILIERYLYIAEIAAKKFVGRGVDYEDLFQVASLALVKAIDRFNIEREIKFSSFATPSLIGEIKNYFRDSSRVLRLPRRDTELLKHLKQYVQEYSLLHGSNPQPKQIAKALEITEERVLEILELQQSDSVMSLDVALSDADNFSLGDILGREDASFERIENHDFLKYCMSLLGDAEKKIIEYRYMNNMTQKQVADLLGVSQMQISRMERKILSKLASAYKK